MKIVLHACCGPCSLEPVRLLREAGHDITIYYANSNIAPLSEYRRRLATLCTWADDEGIPVVEGAYDPAVWESLPGKIGEASLFSVAPTDEDENTFSLLADQRDILRADLSLRQARCRACYRLRFREAAAFAVQEGFDALGTTLSVSPYQYTRIIEEELKQAASAEGIQALFQDYRPFYHEATRRSRELGMYRQNYCGCRFSQAEAAAEREERKAARHAAKEKMRAAHAEEYAAEVAERAKRRAEHAAYDEKRRRQRSILRALRGCSSETTER